MKSTELKEMAHTVWWWTLWTKHTLKRAIQNMELKMIQPQL